MSTSTRSIMRKTDRRSNRRSGPKKRLSFAPSPSPHKEMNTEEQPNKEVTKASNEPTSTESSCKMTPFGLCYDPKASAISEDERHDTVPVMKTQRNNVSTLNDIANQSRTTANVLIVGEKSLGEKLKKYIMDIHHQQDSLKGLNWNIDLNITCEKTLTPAMGRKVHLILYFFMMDTHESMAELNKLLRCYKEDVLPTKRIILLTVLSHEGFYKNVVDLVQFDTLLTSHHLVHIPLKEQGRFSYIWLKRILGLIYKSVGYHRGSSLLMDYITHVTVYWCEGIQVQD